MKNKSVVSFSNISTAVLLAFFMLMFFSPEAKAVVIKGLMQIGFFQPDVDSGREITPALAEDISFTDSLGKTVSLSSLKGKVVFINFWATWCPPCRAEMPSINKLSRNLKDNKNIVFLMVDMDNDYKKAKKYMTRKKFSLPIFTPTSALPESLFSGSLPTTIIFNKRGTLVFKHEGAGDFSGKKVQEYLNKLSAE
ncbi:TlpA disulfide reductase family protein [Daejeonella sp.]|uniref:TlpA family protein disulfide reductase n=1 Tax=Daejeonella sp. TaxID=2805397 RepID=UPI0030C184D4